MKLEVYTIEDADNFEVTLTEEEAIFFVGKPAFRKETYLMKKFIEEFRMFRGGSQQECFKHINIFRQKYGYSIWKSQRSLARLWEELYPNENNQPSQLKQY